jgi:hypothetical protein
MLARRDARFCGDVVQELPLAQSPVSPHLEVPKEVGLIRAELGGPAVCSCIEPRVLGGLQASVGGP